VAPGVAAGNGERGGSADQEPDAVHLGIVRAERRRDRNAEPEPVEGAPHEELGAAALLGSCDVDPAVHEPEPEPRLSCRGGGGIALEDQPVEQARVLETTFRLELAREVEAGGRGVHERTLRGPATRPRART